MVCDGGGSVSVLLISEWNRGHAEAVRVSEYLFASRIKSRVWLFDFSDLADTGYVGKTNQHKKLSDFHFFPMLHLILRLLIYGQTAK